jgi:hypothetical protein
MQKHYQIETRQKEKRLLEIVSLTQVLGASTIIHTHQELRLKGARQVKPDCLQQGYLKRKARFQ